jgi:N-acetylneuraminate synthase
MESPHVIAEVGCNHEGEMEIALELIKVAAVYCKVDFVKFQKRHPRELLSPDEYSRPHPNPMHAFGSTYGAHREFLEFSVDQHRRLQACCREFGVEYSCSVWDVTSAREIAKLGPPYVKVPSATNMNSELLGCLCGEFGGSIHVSLGMTDREEEERIVRFFEDQHRQRDLVLYSCTSGYPVPFDDVCLLEITRLRDRWADTVQAIGFSGHHLGIAADVAAAVLGAAWIERHFTLDRTWKGTDHAASLEPDGMRRVARDVRNVTRAMQNKSEGILEIEKAQREKLKRNQIKWDL